MRFEYLSNYPSQQKQIAVTRRVQLSRGILPSYEETSPIHSHRLLHGFSLRTAVLPSSPSSSPPSSSCGHCCTLTGSFGQGAKTVPTCGRRLAPSIRG